MFTAALFTIAKLWKQPKCLLTDEWRKNMGYIFATEYYSAIKKNRMTWMDLEIMTLKEVSLKRKTNTI